MNQTEANRFAKLIGGLEEQLHRSNFDMSRYTNNPTRLPIEANDLKVIDCGTTCCVMGFTPAIFPKNFTWSRAGVLYALDAGGYRNGLVCSHACCFFGLSPHEYEDLFISGDACGRGYDSQIKYMQNFLSMKGYTDVWVDA